MGAGGRLCPLCQPFSASVEEEQAAETWCREVCPHMVTTTRRLGWKRRGPVVPTAQAPWPPGVGQDVGPRGLMGSGR